MSAATRFPSRASGPAERMAGFLAHLRLNGFAAPPTATPDALSALAAVDALDPAEARLALKTLLAGDAEGWAAFDGLFDAYWQNRGRVREGRKRPSRASSQTAAPALWRRHLGGAGEADDDAEASSPGDAPAEAQAPEGRLLATRTDSRARRDLRRLLDEDTLREAEAAALRLARALRDRRSRRRRAARRGTALDLRRTLRASLARGGEPLDLHRRRRPERPMRILALCDVSGSMTGHARVFLAFLKGLVAADLRADAWLFHLRLMRVTDTLRDRDALRAATRLSLMAEGFGGGTDIAGCLDRLAGPQGSRALGGRTVAVILSDGYCASSPDALAAALARLGRRVRRVVWLDPNAGTAEPGRHIAAALSHVDAHLPARTVADLAALEPVFADL